MNTTDILVHLRNLDIRVDVVDGDLRLRGATNRLPAPLLDAIRATKPALVALLDGSKAGANGLVTAHGVEEAGRAQPLSWSQQRLWFLEQLMPDSALYNVPYALRLTGLLDTGALQRALDELMSRHAILRTSFSETAGIPMQQAMPVAGVAMPVTDLRATAPSARAERVRALASEEAGAPFQLAAGRLLRARLLVLAETEHILLLTVHHIASDGWSLGVLIREFTTLYQAFCSGRASPLAAPTLQYADFARWQREDSNEARLARQLAYWRETLAGVPSQLELPVDRPRAAHGRHVAGAAGFALEGPTLDALQALARRERATLFMVLHAAWALLLSRTTGQTDLVTGTPSAGRDRPELEETIGFFINTLPLRTRIDERLGFTALVRDTRATVLDAFANAEAPFERIVDALGSARDATRSPLVQAMLVFQNLSPARLDLPGLDVESLTLDTRSARFDLTLIASQHDARIDCSFEYDSDLFDGSTIQGYAHRFARLLDGLARLPDAPMREVAWLDHATTQRILADGNGPTPAPSAGLSVRILFERQAAATRAAAAAVHDGRSISFATLNRLANIVGAQLREAGARPGSIVALFAERSIDMIAGLLGIWKAGAAYLPIDPNLPRDRIAYMLDDAQPVLVLAQPHLASRVPQRRTIVPLDCGFRHGTPFLDPAADDGAFNPPAAPQELDQLAYVIYTSGSSGRPKGVAVDGRSLLAATEARTTTVAHYRSLLLIMSLSFDGALGGMLGTLLRGGTLVIPTETQMTDPAALGVLMETHDVDTLFSTPSFYTSLLREASPRALAKLRQIIVAGEAWPATIVGMTRERCPNAILFNEYGPSEATIWASVHEVRGLPTSAPPIGLPIAGWRLHVLDTYGRLVPDGITGELHIGGIGVTRGYLGRPDLTAGRFAPDPFGAPGTRLYRTGDMVRRLPGGDLLYLGRNDDQVKVRGFRIELGEVESGIKALDGVLEAAVLMSVEGEGRRLVAYVVAPGRHASALRVALRETLPEYMVPTRFIELDALPVTSNGKLDRHRLATLGDQAGRDDLVAPTDALESALVAMWATVLALPEVSIDDDFFELGGHSLLATQLMSRVRQSWGDIPLRALFNTPSVRGFADWLRASGRADAARPRSALPAIGSAPKGPVPLSFAQTRLWFLNQFEPNSPFYNMPTALRMTGMVETEVLGRCIAEIARRHSVLRSGFPMRDGAPVQIVDEERVPRLRCVDLRSIVDVDAREAAMLGHARDEAAMPFDLARGPVMRAVLVRMAEDDAVLLFTVHHIVADGWSFGILVRELTALYTAWAQGRASPLPELGRQYGDFAYWQRGWLEGETLERQLGYWQSQLEDAPSLLMLPLDGPRPPEQRHHGANFGFDIPARTGAPLRALASEAGCTLFMALSAAYAVFLSRITGQQDLCFGTPIANRHHAETEEMIGFFVNTLVLRARLDGHPDFRTMLARMRDTALDAYAHQDVPFELLVERLSPERQTSHAPLFQTLLALQNMPVGELTMPGVALNLVDLPAQTAKFDLSLYIVEHDGVLRATFEYDTDLFRPATVARFASLFRTLLDGLVAHPGVPVGMVPMLDKDERALLARGSRQTVAHEPRPLHAWFEEQAARTPDAIALVQGDESITYAELDRRANQLARVLQRAGVAPETPVGICLPRSILAVTAILGALKSGGAYLPLDPNYPAERLAYMIADAQPALVMTDSAVAERTGIDDMRCLLLDRDWPHAESDVAPGALVYPANVAYFIYTSGSTGQPKGTAIPHASVSAFIAWARGAFPREALTRVLASTSLCFDLSVFELFVPLSTGGTAVLVRNILDLAGEACHDITLINTVPSAIAALLRANALPARVHTVNLAGEALPNALAQSLYRHAGIERVVNLYGPTEDTTYSTFATIKRGAAGACPIGRPIDNTQALLLDPYFEPVPPGVVGALYLAGDGLARGYLGRPGLTAERFVPNPHGEPGSRMYATGDLARMQPDGDLDYLGRSDSQVKLRGFRVELGEVETALGALPTVRDAAVVIRPDAGGDPTMTAYVVVGEAASRSPDDDVRQWADTFDAIYGDGTDRVDDFNVAGWNDSYDGAPLNEGEMREWVHETVARIAALMPATPAEMLEIGCGTGLLLHRLVSSCARYVGTDISSKALKLVQRARTHAADACRVELHETDARTLPVGLGEFDTVVVNSVAQYFPDEAYLADVLTELVARTRDGGHVFLGDVRHLSLLRAFQTSIEMFHASDDTALARLDRAVTQNVERETELLVDPAWFFAVAKSLPRIARVEVLPKAGFADNELTRYRYDVVLTIGEPTQRLAVAPLDWQPWAQAGATPFALPESGVLALRGVPDALLANDVLAAHLLAEPHLSDVSQLRAACTRQVASNREAIVVAGAVSRTALRANCESAGLSLATARAGGDAGTFHCVIWREAAGCADLGPIDWAPLYSASEGGHIVNTPSSQQHRFRVRNELRRQLQRKLPDFLMPTHLVLLDEMPRTPNGKLDRKALPAPDLVDYGTTHAAPNNAVERALADIWTDILAVERLGIHDNFFELGGHSLIATRLVARINDSLGLKLPVRAIFETPSIAALAARIEEEGGPRHEPGVPPIVPVPREIHMPTSFAQQRLWVLDRLNPGNPFYNMPVAVRLTGAMDIDVLARTVTELVKRHEVLRTTLPAVGGMPVQLIAEPAPVMLALSDLSALPHAEREARVAVEAEAEALAPFDLAAGPLFRVSVLRLGPREHVLLFTLHHIVADGWSMSVLVQEVGTLYAAFRAGQPSPLPSLAIQYADYSAWQRTWLSRERLEAQLAYWTSALEDLPPLLALPTDRPRPPVQRFRGAIMPVAVSAPTTAALKALASGHRATLFMLLIAAYDVLLARYSGQTDIAVGTVLANRNQRESEQLIGFFVNTLVIRLRIDMTASFISLLDATRGAALDAYANQDVPFEQVVSALNPGRDLSHAPLVQATFVLQNAPRSDLDIEELVIAPLAAGHSTSRYDLSLNMAEEGDSLSGRFEYDTDLFDASTIRALSRGFTALLDAIAADPSQRVGALGAQAVVSASTGATTSFVAPDVPIDGTGSHAMVLHRLIEAQAARLSEAIALRTERESLSYGALNARANRLARYLRRHGIGADAIVALHLERSIDLIVAMLGVLKAGAAFLPVDPAYPIDRRAYILDDSACACVITHSDMDAVSDTLPTMYLDAVAPLVDGLDDSNPDLPISPDNLAYVIYTSGSTGQPKGIGATHAGMCSLADLAGPGSPLEVRQGQCVLQFASLSFDAAIWEFVCSLTTGATLQIAPRDQIMPGLTLEDTLRRHGVNVVLLPPVALSAFTPAALPALELVISAGEALPAAVAANWAVQGIRFVNAYGPTETTVCATVHTMPIGGGPTPSIGSAIRNVGVAVVDARGESVPTGAVGELLVFGQGVSRGYLGRPALTADRFRPNPFGPAGSRAYATGDMVRAMPDGTLHYIGRSDDQIKLRGFRIELGEVEAALASCPGVRYAVANTTPGPSGQPRLTAYIVEEAEEGSSDRWSGIFEQMYKEGEAPVQHDFDILGWTSSYDGRSIPADEMREWVDQTIGRINALDPRRTLEIGCGTGLLVHRVAPNASTYLATDLSLSALARLEGTLATAGIRNVTLRQCMANRLDTLPGRFDTVVTNSVAQYFTDEAYLRTVVDGAIERIDDGGHLFLGDVRHGGLMRVFHTSLALFRTTLDAPSAAVAAFVEEAHARETELLIDPAWFFALCENHPRVRHVSVRIKAGHADNELTQYRYDVVLAIDSIDARAVERPEWRHWAGLDALDAWLGDPVTGLGHGSIAVRDVPDARLAWPAFVAARLGEDDEASVADWQTDFVLQPGETADIRALTALAKQHRATVEFMPASGAEGRVHVVFQRAGALPAIDVSALYGAPAGAPLVNTPKRERATTLSRADILRHVRQRVPEYMVPSQVVMLDHLPLTPNGKVDRAALPAPRTDVVVQNAVGATREDRMLTALWSELLGLSQIGPDDDFFELGGHSLLAVQLIAAIGERFGIDMSLAQLFQTPTIAGLGAELAARRPARRMIEALNSGTEGAPLYLIHASDGDAACYAELARAKRDGQPVFGVSTPEVAGEGETPAGFDALCSRYAQAIDAHALQGEVCVAGWSVGGSFAIEVAARLEARHRTVRWVALLDTTLLGDDSNETHPGIGLQAVVQWLINMSPEEIARRYGRDIDALKQRIAAVVARDGIDDFVDALEHDPERLETAVGFPRALQRQLLSYQRAMNFGLRMTEQFVPSVLAAPLHTVWSQETLERGAQADAWQRYTRAAEASLSTTLPASHFEFVLGRQAVPLAAVLDGFGTGAGPANANDENASALTATIGATEGEAR